MAKTVSNLTCSDFGNCRYIRTIVAAICDRDSYNSSSEFDIMFSIKEFVRYIREKLEEESLRGHSKEDRLAKELLCKNAVRLLPFGEDRRDLDSEFEQMLKAFNFADLVVFFNRIYSTIHHSGFLLEHIYPEAPKEFFDTLSDLPAQT